MFSRKIVDFLHKTPQNTPLTERENLKKHTCREMTFFGEGGGEGSDILFITGSNKCYGRYYIFFFKIENCAELC